MEVGLRLGGSRNRFSGLSYRADLVLYIGTRIVSCLPATEYTNMFAETKTSDKDSLVRFHYSYPKI